MAEKIYIRNASGNLEPLTEERFETEDLLQELIGQHPELLAGEQMRPDDPLRWILIRREMPIEGWALDHLLIDQHSRPTLVEVKRGSNREIRRNIVGQMLDYAATAAGVWTERDMRRIFEESSNNPDDEIANLLGDNSEPDIDAFWEQVATNLAANRLRLLFVADKIPPQLERVVKFLNEQTRENIEVLAVEIKQYPGQSTQTLVSRVIGQVSAVPANGVPDRPSRTTLDRLLNSLSPEVRTAVDKLIENAQTVGAIIDSKPNSVTIGARCPAYRNITTNVAQFYLPTDADERPFKFRIYFDHPNIQVQTLLRQWITQFDNDDFGLPYSFQGWMPGRSIGEQEMVKNSGVLSRRLEDVIEQLRELQPSEAD